MKSKRAMNQTIPQVKTDYDLSGFRPTHFEFQPKAARLNIRLPEALVDALKTKAAAHGIPYQRFVRLVLEQAVH